MNAALRIGIDLGGSKIEAVMMQADGQISHRLRCATPQGDYAATLNAISQLVLQLDNKTGQRCNVGICTPGAVAPHNGLMQNCNSTCLNGRALREDLSAQLQRQIRIANDADCFALSEAKDGAAAGASSVFGVILGTGVGGGFVFNGQLLQGPSAIAGEWGHNALPWPDEHELPGAGCYCGKQGCIETWLSGPALAADHQLHNQQRLSAEQIAELSRHNHPAAQQTLQRHAQRLAKALASVINIIDPEVIVLGGGLSNMPQLYQQVPQLWQQWVFSAAPRTLLRPAKYGDASGVRGAAWLCDSA